jgi:hypothetical protein
LKPRRDDPGQEKKSPLTVTPSSLFFETRTEQNSEERTQQAPLKLARDARFGLHD